jgi:hypothetical protein
VAVQKKIVELQLAETLRQLWFSGGCLNLIQRRCYIFEYRRINLKKRRASRSG